MPLRKTGVRLVAQDARQFQNDIRGSQQATDTFSKSLKTLGIVAAGLTLARATAGMLKSAVGATSAYEQLSMSMSSLVAKELRAKDATLDIGDAMDMAKEQAEGLLGWIQQLAVASPFDMQGVAAAFRTALAYGFTSDEARRLTEVTIDFATATGQSVGVMNQVALALGQIKAKGKLAGQEILQLVNAGFSVNPILEKLGYNMSDVSKGVVKADEFLNEFVKTLGEDFGGAAQRSAGTIAGLTNSLQDLQEIGLRELFGPAIQAMVPALQALVDKVQLALPSLKIMGQFLGGVTKTLIENRSAIIAATAGMAAFFIVLKAGTIISTVTALIGALTAAVTFMLSPLGLAAAAAALIVGGLVSLRQATAQTEQAVGVGVGQIGDDFENMGEAVRGTAENTGKNAHSWGYNLIINFANGMAKAVQKVLDVLITMGNAIAQWLSPGSPPRLLPEIDKWGQAAMQEFVNGFATADFGIFKQMASDIEQYLRSTAEGDSTSLIPDIAKARAGLATIVAEFRRTGQVTGETLNLVSSDIHDYVNAMLEAARANENVVRAQEALNEVSQRYNELLSPMRDELNDIQKRRQEIIDQQRVAELQSIINDENAPAMAKELAQMELREIELRNQIATTEDRQAAEEEAAQAALTAAEQQAQAAAEEFMRQQELLGLRTENNNLLAQQLSLLERLNNALGSVGSVAAQAGKSISEALGGLSFGGGASPLSALADEFSGLVEDLEGPLAEVKAKFEEVKVAWAGVGLSIQERLKPVTDALTTAWGPGGTWSGNMENLKTILGLLQLRWNTKMDAMKEKLRIYTDKLKSWWGEGGAWQTFIETVKANVTDLDTRWDESFGEEGLFVTVMNGLNAKLDEWWGEDGLWKTIILALKRMLDDLVDTTFAKVKEGINSVLTAVENAHDAFKNFVDMLANTDLSSLNPFTANSPAPLAVGLNQIRGQLRGLSNSELPAFGSKLKNVDMPANSSQVAMASRGDQINYDQRVYDFGKNTINNGMDAQLFQAMIVRTLENML